MGRMHACDVATAPGHAAATWAAPQPCTHHVPPRAPRRAAHLQIGTAAPEVVQDALEAAVDTVAADPDFKLHPDAALDGRAAARWCGGGTTGSAAPSQRGFSCRVAAA